MTIKTTTWSPDTCTCVIKYKWDDSTSEDARVHEAYETVTACPTHSGKSVADTHNAIMEENLRKNKTFALLLTVKGIQATDGEKISQAHRDFSYSFDKDRNLIVNIKNLTALQENQLKGLADAAFGPGKVILSPS